MPRAWAHAVGAILGLNVPLDIGEQVFDQLLDSRVGRVLEVHFEELFGAILLDVSAVVVKEDDGVELSGRGLTLRGYSYTFLPSLVFTTRRGTLIALY